MKKSWIRCRLAGALLCLPALTPALAQLDAMSLTPLTPEQAEHQGVINAVDPDTRSLIVNGKPYRVDVNTRFFQAGRRGPFQVFQPTDIRSLMGERVAIRVDDQGRVQELIRLTVLSNGSGS